MAMTPQQARQRKTVLQREKRHEAAKRQLVNPSRVDIEGGIEEIAQAVFSDLGGLEHLAETRKDQVQIYAQISYIRRLFEEEFIVEGRLEMNTYLRLVSVWSALAKELGYERQARNMGDLKGLLRQMPTRVDDGEERRLKVAPPELQEHVRPPDDEEDED